MSRFRKLELHRWVCVLLFVKGTVSRLTVFLWDLHPEQPQLLQPVQRLRGDLSVRVDLL